MRVTVLGSGSSGNATLLQLGDSAVLIDAGFCCTELERRIRGIGADPGTVKALIISHEHTDHMRGAEVFSRRHKVPIYISEATLESVMINRSRVWGIEKFEVGSEFSINGLTINPFKIAHDAVDPSAFVVSGAGAKAGIGTDLGYVTRLVEAKFTGLDLLVLESNYDPEMLITGPYPWYLKQRIASRNGHLSNPDMAEFVQNFVNFLTRHLLLAHLSRTNNTPSLAYRSCRDALDIAGNSTTRIHMTNQFVCSETIDLEAE